MDTSKLTIAQAAQKTLVRFSQSCDTHHEAVSASRTVEAFGAKVVLSLTY